MPLGDAYRVIDAHSTGGNDTLVGGANSPSNTLVGDVVWVYADATGGDDRLVSGDNSPDQMWGDFQNVISGSVEGGHDTFVFGPGNGNDFIYDFRQGVRTPSSLMASGSLPWRKARWTTCPAEAFSHLLENFAGVTIETVGADSVIHFDDSNSVTVLGVSHLTVHDFHFLV